MPTSKSRITRHKLDMSEDSVELTLSSQRCKSKSVKPTKSNSKPKAKLKMVVTSVIPSLLALGIRLALTFPLHTVDNTGDSGKANG